jgi:hypothetical protein
MGASKNIPFWEFFQNQSEITTSHRFTKENRMSFTFKNSTHPTQLVRARGIRWRPGGDATPKILRVKSKH